ncbi:MAG: lysine biosynthesis protein LysW [Chloroflexi bacterium]|nr:lysine biosynthesis protein LysW [Chloroflexota bacterium]
MCDATQEISADAMLNELIACGDCGGELEIVSLQPLRLELAPPCEEDWGE